MKKMNDAQQMQMNIVMMAGIVKLGYTWDTREQFVEDCKEYATKSPLDYALWLIHKVGVKEVHGTGNTGFYYDLLKELGDPLNDAHLLTGMQHWYKNNLFL